MYITRITFFFFLQRENIIIYNYDNKNVSGIDKNAVYYSTTDIVKVDNRLEISYT